VAGRDAIDDQPGAGHNASVLLGFLASYLAEVLPGGAEDARVCIAGLHTGTLHNRVYGRGQLLLNLAYGSTSTGRLLEAVTETAVAEGVARFRGRFRGHRDLALTAAEADSVTTVEWLKRGLPALSGTDPWVDLIAAEAGLARWPDGDLAFTCDAIWMHGLKDAATIVLGPGDLVEGNAHAAGEHIDIGEMDGFASDIARLLVAFARAGGFDGSGS
jgi:acetylornithine deacetylase/succinyl-diaminopimelate desuccinylase-like protein